MSDNWLLLVPADPTFAPSPEAAKLARNLLAEFVPESDEVVADFNEAIVFFDAGGNWSGVECPACGKNAETWWAHAMDEAFKTAFQKLRVSTPCCGTQVSLNDMRYGWPVAFGRFALTAMNPNVRDLSSEQEAKLSNILDCELRKVWRHI
jgi:hypothetical protein